MFLILLQFLDGEGLEKPFDSGNLRLQVYFPAHWAVQREHERTVVFIK